jgi:hypothetical protein
MATTVEQLWKAVEGINDVAASVHKDLMIPSESKPAIAAQRRQAEIDRIRQGAAHLLSEGLQRVVSTNQAVDVSERKYKDSRNWQKASVLATEVQAWAGSVKSWDELARRVDAAAGDREELEALRNLALPTMVKRSVDPTSPLRDKASMSAQLEQTIELRLVEILPGDLKNAVANAQAAQRELQATREEINSMSLVISGPNDWGAQRDALRDIYSGAKPGLFANAQESAPERAPGIFERA